MQEEVYFVLFAMFIEELYVSSMIYLKANQLDSLNVSHFLNSYVALKSLHPQT